MYDPTTARWMSKDPIGFEGSRWNLYQYVNSRPTTLVDPNGLGGGAAVIILCRRRCPPASQRTPAACCAAAAAAGLAGTSAGGVVCCDGRMVACVWATGGVAAGGGTGNAAADAIIDACITAHENQHISQGDIAGPCPTQCGTLSRPPFPWTTRWFGNPNQQECAAYRVELDCLSRSAAMCGGVAACETAVNNRASFVSGQIASRCR